MFKDLKLIIQDFSTDLKDVASERPDTFLELEAVSEFPILDVLTVERKPDCAHAVENFAEVWPSGDVGLKQKTSTGIWSLWFISLHLFVDLTKEFF